MTATADTSPLPADSQPVVSTPKSDANPLKSPDRLILLALLLGIAVDFLFYRKPVGISFPIFIGFGLLVLLTLAIVERVRPSLASLWLVIPAMVFAVMVFIRAEPLTTFVNVCVTLALGVLLIRTFIGGALFKFGLIDFGVNGLLGAVETAFRPWPVLATAGRDSVSAPGRRRVLLPIIRGLLLAAPIMFIFALLLGSADLVFGDRIHDLLEALNLDNIPELMVRSVLIAMAAFAAIGLFVQALRPIRYSLIGENGTPVQGVLGSIEVTIVLAGINLLFAAFVVIQFQYLFGGTANISLAGYNYSEYARRGFGELTAVVFLTLLILLTLSSLVRLETLRETLSYKLLNVIAGALVGVIVVSALQRLLLYEDIYGFTRLRTYAHVAIIWLGLLFVPYLVALLAGRLRWFAPGVLLAVLGFTATLNALNVDQFIALRNIDRFTRGLEVHAYYLITLSDDALPELLGLYDRGDETVNAVLGPGLACRAEQIVETYGNAAWQSTHQSHQQALDLLRPDAFVAGGLPLTHHPDGNYVYANGERVSCYDLLQSFVLEPGLTSEYRRTID